MAVSARRAARVSRKTRETEITLSLSLDGRGLFQGETGIPFFDHMLELWCGHGLFDLRIRARGDLEVDQHHLVEDTGIVLGQAFARAIGDKRGLHRYGYSCLPMDESLVEAVLDLSGRPFLAYGLKLRQRRLARFDTELVPEFLRAWTQHAGATLHVVQRAGGNTHHLVEAAFKALGRAAAQASARDARRRGAVPSTKGSL